MAGVVDSYGFMQLDPFIRCNSHWVRDFFPTDDGETLKEAKATGVYTIQPILKILPNYTERELTERELLQRRGVFELDEPPVEVHGENREYVNWHWVRREIERDADDRQKWSSARRNAKSSRARYKPDEGVLGYAPPEPHFGDGRTSWVEANPDTWDHLNFQDTQLIRSLAQPSKDDPEQVKELIEKIKVNLHWEMSAVYYPADLVVAWKNFFAAMKAIPKLREKLKEFTYEI